MLGVEVIRDLARPISLTVRIYANVSFGAALVRYVFESFIINNYYILGLRIFILLIFYELFVALVQRYIFSYLVYMYYND